MKKPRLPQGWTEERIRSVLDHYENQTEEEAVAEDEAAFRKKGTTVMVVPTKLVPEIQTLIARRDRTKKRRRAVAKR